MFFLCSFLISICTRAEDARSKCIHLGELIGKVSASEHIWQTITHLDVKGSEITRGFEREALKRFFVKTHSVRKNQPYPFTVEQEGCDKVHFLFGNDQKETFKVASASRHHIELIPEKKKSVSLHFSADENIKVESMRYKLKRFDGHLILEKASYVEFSIANKCEFSNSKDQASLDRQTAAEGNLKRETHVVEVQEVISWSKPVQAKRFVSEKMLQLLMELTSDLSSTNPQQFASCEFIPPARTISSILFNR